MRSLTKIPALLILQVCFFSAIGQVAPKPKTGNPAPVRSAAPVPGKYVCYQALYTYTYIGSFVVSSPTSYQFTTGKKSKGTYRYDSASGKITWVSGDLKGMAGSYSNTEQNGPVIKVWATSGPTKDVEWHCSCKERLKS